MQDREKKIVIVDDNQGWGETLQYALIHANPSLSVAIIHSAGMLVEEMVEKAVEEQPSLVITGVRNRDNLDENDGTGIEMASQLERKQITTFVVSNGRYAAEVKKRGLYFYDQAHGLPHLLESIFNYLSFWSVGEIQDAD